MKKVNFKPSVLYSFMEESNNKHILQGFQTHKRPLNVLNSIEMDFFHRTTQKHKLIQWQGDRRSICHITLTYKVLHLNSQN